MSSISFTGAKISLPLHLLLAQTFHYEHKTAILLWGIKCVSALTLLSLGARISACISWLRLTDDVLTIIWYVIQTDCKCPYGAQTKSVTVTVRSEQAVWSTEQLSLWLLQTHGWTRLSQLERFYPKISRYIYFVPDVTLQELCYPSEKLRSHSHGQMGFQERNVMRRAAGFCLKTWFQFR